ncbi:MAG: hypothetical protein M3301_09120 [Chloroflexota bacterium]|nr:hypothetical protein [Chloroflexota bacterium]
MTDRDALPGWFAQRLPRGWFAGPPAVVADRDEILVVGTLPHADGVAEVRNCAAWIARFREESREERMRVAAEAEQVFERRISWGATCHGVTRLFTTWSAPVMTRLRLPERAVLDTLVAAGVARSRSDALAWCVRLVAANEGEWLRNLREALSAVETLRAGGPRP